MLPKLLSSEESACQCRRHRFDPWVRKTPWRRKGWPTPVFLPGESHGQRRPMAYSPWGHKESDMTEWLNNPFRVWPAPLKGYPNRAAIGRPLWAVLRTVYLPLAIPGPHGTAWLQKETQATSGLGDGVLGWTGNACPGCSLGFCVSPAGLLCLAPFRPSTWGHTPSPLGVGRIQAHFIAGWLGRLVTHERLELCFPICKVGSLIIFIF